MTSIQDKLHNFLVLEDFNLLQQNNLEPKLGIYGGDRLIIVSQKRTNFFAKIYQLFLNFIYNPLLSICKKLSIDQRRVTELKKEVEILQGDFSDKQRSLNDLSISIEVQKQEFNTYESRLSGAKQETEIVENELLQKKQALNEAKAAENRVASLNLQIEQLENRLKDLSDFEKQRVPAEQKITALRQMINQLESQVSRLKTDREQLIYKNRCESLEHEIGSLQSALRKAEEIKYRICLDCGASVI